MKSCSSCISGFYLATEDGYQICMPRRASTLGGCKSFNAASDSCNTCYQETHYISSSGCIPRKNIANCATFETNEDSCVKCTHPELFYARFDPSISDGLYYCLPRTKNRNCLEVDDNLRLDSCKSCIEGFILANYGILKNCLTKNTALNCLVYSNTVSKCKSCVEGYYLNTSPGIEGDCILRPEISMCKTYVTDMNACEECEKGYYLNSATQCKRRTPIKACDSYKAAEDKCSSCIPDYYVNSSGRCSLRIESHPTKCSQKNDADDTCVTCSSSGYYMSSGVCKPVTPVDNCGEYAATSDTCKTCSDKAKYYLDKTANKCMERVKNPSTSCETSGLADEADECTTCLRSTYYQSGKNCIQRRLLSKTSGNINYCKTYKIDGEGCDECNIGSHYQNGLQCIQRTVVTGCSTYTANADSCATCNYSNYYANGILCTLRVNSHPDVCDSTGRTDASDVCTKCITTHYLDTGVTPNICKVRSAEASGARCATTLPTADTCTQCQTVVDFDILSGSTTYTGYYLSGSATSCSASTPVADCTNYSSTEDKCISCQNKFYISPTSTCTASTSRSGCKTYSSTEDHCAVCSSYRYLSAVDICSYRTTSENCATFSTVVGEDKCLTCYDLAYSYLSNDNCPSRSKSLSTNNCSAKKDDISDDCATCATGYYLTSTFSCEAQPSIPDCQTYSITTKSYCGVCYISTHFNSNGKCIARSINILCDTYNPTEDKCATCNEGGYLSSLGACLSGEIQGCVTYTSETVCSECDDTLYYQSGTTCALRTLDPDCVKFTIDQDSCETCNSGFYYDGYICRQQVLSEGCETMKASQDKCETCLTGYWLEESSSSCIKITEIAGCETYLSPIQCAYCTKTNVLSFDGSKCLPLVEDKKISFCDYHSEYIRENDLYHNCLKCIAGFSPKTVNSRSTCVPDDIPDGCVDNTCQKCTSPTYYSVGFSATANMQVCMLADKIAAPPVDTGSESANVTVPLTNVTNVTSSFEIYKISTLIGLLILSAWI